MSLDCFIRLTDSIVEFEADRDGKRFPMESHHAIDVHKYKLRSNWSRVKAAYEKFITETEKEVADGEERIDIESHQQKYKNTYTTYCNCLT